MTNFATVREALEEIKKGKLLILLDHPKRENEADFYIPTDKLTIKHLMTMIRLGGGLICCAITKAQVKKLSLPLMVKIAKNSEKTKVNFTVSVNAKNGITTGISAYDRFKTIKILADPFSKPEQLTKPGHVFGLVASQGGLLKRAGHTEAAIELSKQANLTPAGVLCEILSDTGHMADLKELINLSKKLDIKILTIDELTEYING